MSDTIAPTSGWGGTYNPGEAYTCPTCGDRVYPGHEKFNCTAPIWPTDEQAHTTAAGMLSNELDDNPLGIQQWAHDWKHTHGDAAWYPLVVALAEEAGAQIRAAEADTPDNDGATQFNISPDFDALTVELQVPGSGTFDLDADNACRIGLAFIDAARRLYNFESGDDESSGTETSGNVIRLVPRSA